MVFAVPGASGADGLGLASDRDPRVTWLYRQERAGVREYGVRVEIRAREEAGG